MNIKNTIEMTKPIYMSGPLVYVNKSGENEFTYLVTKANQEIQNNLKSENQDLRECIKMLQKELLEIIQLKSNTFSRRYNNEFKQELNEDFAKHNIVPVKEDLINMPFDNCGKDIISQFQANIRKLRDFLLRVDKDMEEIFNEESNNDEFDDGNQFSNIRSINHLRHLLKNYKALAEAQEAVIQGDLVTRSKIPPPQEIITPHSRFRIISDREIENMKKRLEKQRILVEKHQNEIEVMKNFSNMGIEN